MSAIRPHSKRERRRSSSSGISLGAESEVSDDLLAGFVELVEGVEELLLRPLLARDELDVVDQEDVDGAVLGAELGDAVVADRVDELVGEALGREVEHAQARVEAGDLVADRVQQVGLAEADAAVDEERVVGLRRQLGDGLAGGLGELVGVADDEGVEGVARGETGRTGPRASSRAGAGRGGRARRSISIGDARDCRRAPSRAAVWIAEVCAGRASHGVYLLGAAMRMSSPSSAVTRHGRSQDSRALAGIGARARSAGGPTKSQAFLALGGQGSREVTHRVIHRCG